MQARYTALRQGTGATAGAFVQRLYLSSATIPDEDDEIAGEYTFSSTVEAGERYGRSVPINLPDTTGPVYLIVETDATGTQLELDEANNATESASTNVSAAYESTLLVSMATVVAAQTVSRPQLQTDSDDVIDNIDLVYDAYQDIANETITASGVSAAEMTEDQFDFGG